MPRKQGRPALSPEEREERREERNRKARDERATKRERTTRDDNDYDDEPRGRSRGRSPGLMMALGVIVTLGVLTLIGKFMREPEEENAEIVPAAPRDAQTILVKRMDDTVESLQSWTEGITRHAAKHFAQQNAETKELEQRISAVEKRASERE